MKCLDANFLIDVLRGFDVAKNAYHKLAGEKLIVPSVVAFELYKGLVWSRNAEREEALIEEELAEVEVVPFTHAEARLAGTISRQMHKSGTPVSPVDAMIAATALTSGCELVTADKNFARVRGLKVMLYA